MNFNLIVDSFGAFTISRIALYQGIDGWDNISLTIAMLLFNYMIRELIL